MFYERPHLDGDSLTLKGSWIGIESESFDFQKPFSVVLLERNEYPSWIQLSSLLVLCSPGTRWVLLTMSFSFNDLAFQESSGDFLVGTISLQIEVCPVKSWPRWSHVALFFQFAIFSGLSSNQSVCRFWLFLAATTLRNDFKENPHFLSSLSSAKCQTT